MTKARLLVHHGICQTRAVVLDAQGRPVRTYLATDFDDHLHLGDIAEGTIAKVSPTDGGCFVRLQNRHEGFLSHRSASDFIEGQHVVFRVAAEARADKLARLVIATDADRKQIVADPFARWRNALPDHLNTDPEAGEAVARQIDAVFEDALSPIAPLRNGGRLQITPTPALIAIDIDTIGRRDKGRASVRAKTVNVDAAGAAGRQMALRELGGNIVLDCIAPLAKPDASAVKAAFVDGFRAASTRKISCLPPSPLGMMEAIIEHGARPLHERLDTHAPATQLLTGLRRVEIEAIARPADLLDLRLPKSGFALYQTHKKIIHDALQARFGGRIVVRESQTQTIEITSQ